MKKLRFTTSLITSENDYQREQAMASQEAAKRLGVEAEIIYAGNDAINQSQQLLNLIQTKSEIHPDGIICHPVGTGLVQVARAAVAAGIGWAVVNRDVDYLGELRLNSRAPSFCVTVDQEEVGRIEAEQLRTLLPQGGLVLYIAGPPGNFSAERRMASMKSSKPANVDVRFFRARWTEESGYEAIRSWLRLSTSQQAPVALVCGQNDNMALGAKRAFQSQIPAGGDWSKILFIGCDACGFAGKERVRNRTLAASIELPATAGVALETFVRFYRAGHLPAERAQLAPVPFPSLEELGS